VWAKFTEARELLFTACVSFYYRRIEPNFARNYRDPNIKRKLSQSLSLGPSSGSSRIVGTGIHGRHTLVCRQLKSTLGTRLPALMAVCTCRTFVIGP